MTDVTDKDNTRMADKTDKADSNKNQIDKKDKSNNTE